MRIGKVLAGCYPFPLLAIALFSPLRAAPQSDGCGAAVMVSVWRTVRQYIGYSRCCRKLLLPWGLLHVPVLGCLRLPSRRITSHTLLFVYSSWLVLLVIQVMCPFSMSSSYSTLCRLLAVAVAMARRLRHISISLWLPSIASLSISLTRSSASCAMAVCMAKMCAART